VNDNYRVGLVPDPALLRKRRSAFVRVMGSLLGWGIVFGIFASAIAGWGYVKYTAPGPLAQAKIVQLEKGLDRTAIAGILQDQGVIADARIFNFASAFTSLRGRYIKPGEYDFAPAISMADVMRQMQQGRAVTYKVTIPEGWTTAMALARLAENDILTGDISAPLAEGSLLADTFVFQRGMTRDRLVTMIATAQTEMLDQLWSKRPPDHILKTKQELVTLASIVEKETAKAEERPLVAAVFLNRLKKNMRLQSDPTIIYGLVGGKGRLDRALTRSDIDGHTPYNTYQIDGLPPGPIANPGRAAMEAVINPAAVDYLYFVADGSGGHAFAATLEEHNANVASWRRVEDAAPPQPIAPTPATPPESAPIAPGPVEAQENATGLEAVPLEPAPPAEPVANEPAIAPELVAAPEKAAAPEAVSAKIIPKPRLKPPKN
jgi:UPF0755 protein